MSKVFARPLLDQMAVEDFLQNCLGIKNSYQSTSGNTIPATQVVKKIRDAESAVSQTKGEPTFSSTRNRVRDYREDSARNELREKILDELIAIDRLDNDEELALGVGGAKPKGISAIANSQAYIVIGLPASGKSFLVNSIADKLGAMILDSDFAKRKLPEFDNTAAGANLVHKESSIIVWGGQDDAPSLFGYCKKNKLNCVVPTIGQDYQDLKEKRDLFIAAGYEVHLTATLLPREVATKRALERFVTTGRYVPLGLIFDGYANDPAMNYFKARVDSFLDKEKNWATFGAIATSTRPPAIEDCSANGNPVHILRSVT